MAYVPDDSVLGNPGIFGFISKAVSSVAKVLTGGQTIKLPQPIINVTSPAPQVQVGPSSTPPWVIPVVIGVAAIVVLPKLLGGRRA